MSQPSRNKFWSSFYRCTIIIRLILSILADSSIVWLLFSRKSFELSQFSETFVWTATFQISLQAWNSEADHFDFGFFLLILTNKFLAFLCHIEIVFCVDSTFFYYYFLWTIELSQQLQQSLSVIWINRVSVVMAFILSI